MRGRPKNSDYRNAVFKCLVNAGGTLWVNQISRLTGIPSKTVTNILDEFQEKGLIEDRDFSKETQGKIKMRLVSLKQMSREDLLNRLKAERIIAKIKGWESEPVK